MPSPTPPARQPAPQGFALRLALFFFGYFTIGGVVTPFFPVWLQSRGLSEVEIADVIAFQTLARVLLTPFAGIFADRAPNRRFAAIALIVPGVLIFLLAYPAIGFWQILLTTGASFTLYQLALPVVEALALTGVRRFGLDYGRMRVSGSIAFIVVNLGSGALISVLHADAIFWIIVGTLFSGLVASFILPVTSRSVRQLDDAIRPTTRPDWRLLMQPGLLALILVGALVQASHAVLYSFGSIHWHALGFDSVDIGAFWAIGIVFEVTLFSFSGRAVRAFGPFGLLVIGGLAAIVRWFGEAQDPGFIGFMALQGLHGLTFAGTYLGNQHVIARMVPDEITASAQGLFAMVSGLIMAGSTVLAGPLYRSFGAEAYLFMIAFPVAAFFILAGYWVTKRGRV